MESHPEDSLLQAHISSSHTVVYAAPGMAAFWHNKQQPCNNLCLCD